MDIGMSTPGNPASVWMVIMWYIVYLATAVLAWGYLPLMRDYWLSGEFTKE